MNVYESLLLEIHSNPIFKQYLEKEVLPRRPSIPTYHPGKNNVEDWKYQSGLRDGFDLMLQLLKVKYD